MWPLRGPVVRLALRQRKEHSCLFRLITCLKRCSKRCFNWSNTWTSKCLHGCISLTAENKALASKMLDYSTVYTRTRRNGRECGLQLASLGFSFPRITGTQVLSAIILATTSTVHRASPVQLNTLLVECTNTLTASKLDRSMKFGCLDICSHLLC